MTNRYVYITLLTLLGFNTETCTQVLAQTPRLVVSIHVDQLRTDFLEDYMPAYTDDGLRQLLNEGVVFPRASFCFSPVDLAAATATLSTGAMPYYHGITGLEWLQRETLRPQSILYDTKYKLSPAQLSVSTISDELKMSTQGAAIVYAFAPTAEAAILSAGHAANGAAWIQKGRWQTTGYYEPLDPWLDQFRKSYVPDADENMSVAKAAVFCVDKTSIGLDDQPDLLYVTLKATPGLSGYLSLDRSVAYIVSNIIRKLTRERVLFVLVGTGNSEEDEHQINYERFRIPTGKFYINRTAGLLNLYLGAIYGTGQYVETSFKNQLYLNRQLISRKNINIGDVLKRSQEFILQLAGVRNVYTSLQLTTSDSEMLRNIRNGFHADRCGDLVIEVTPGWKIINEDAHTSWVTHSSNIPFPIVFFGTNIKPQRIETPVITDRVAPTLARSIRIRAPNACSAEPLF